MGGKGKGGRGEATHSLHHPTHPTPPYSMPTSPMPAHQPAQPSSAHAGRQPSTHLGLTLLHLLLQLLLPQLAASQLRLRSLPVQRAGVWREVRPRAGAGAWWGSQLGAQVLLGVRVDAAKLVSFACLLPPCLPDLHAVLILSAQPCLPVRAVLQLAQAAHKLGAACGQAVTLSLQGKAGQGRQG